MPAVLIELGFLSNPEEEARLAAPVFQDRIATALLECVIRFRDALEREQWSGTAPPGAFGPEGSGREPR